MPILFAILAQKRGVDVSLSTAPAHVFVKFRDETGQIVNLETTSGALPARDEWIAGQMGVTDEAIESGIFLKTMSSEESAAVIAYTLVEQAMAERRYSDVHVVAEQLLEINPVFVEALLATGSAWWGIIQTEFVEKYPDPNDIPSELRPRLQHAYRQNAAAFERAEALGWREPQPE